MTETVLDDSINDTFPPIDVTGNAAYAAEFRYQRLLQFGSAGLLIGLLISVGVSAWEWRRPPVVLVVRVDDVGHAQAVRYDALHYTPREAEVKARLNEWAIDRYRLLKAVAGNFKLNYDYLSASLAGDAMQRDSARLAKIVAGTDPEQDVQIENIQFTSINPQRLPDGAVASGTASIDLTKIIDPNGQNEHQHWTVTLKYEVNPQYAAIRGESDPQFQNLNPLGVTVVWFHEDRAFR